MQDSMLVDRCFAGSYAQARERFVTAAAAAGAVTTSWLNPRVAGPAGEELRMDTAWFGDPAAQKVLLAVSGTHGQEGFAGGATQLQWMLRNEHHGLPPGIGVLFIHAVNPWGWAHLSRTTENNVDLNRNFVDHANVAPASPLHAELDRLMSDCHSPSIAALDEMWARVSALAKQHGPGNLANALAAGQFANPAGQHFGGHAPEWSNGVLRAALRKHLSSANKIAFIDWHTGMGDFGEPYFLCFKTEGGALFELAAKWWGEEAVRKGAREAGGMPRPDYIGLLFHGVEAELAHAQMTGAVIEFGTYPIADTFKAIIVDGWIKSGFAADITFWREWMMERFYPANREWRTAVLRHGARIYDEALRGLSVW